MNAYLYVITTLLLTVYGQLAMKWSIANAPNLGSEYAGKFGFILNMLKDPWVLSAYCSALMASLVWMLALERLPLSVAYPFMSLAFPLTLLFSSLLLGEEVTFSDYIGTLIIALGLWIIVADFK